MKSPIVMLPLGERRLGASASARASRRAAGTTRELGVRAIGLLDPAVEPRLKLLPEAHAHVLSRAGDAADLEVAVLVPVPRVEGFRRRSAPGLREVVRVDLPAGGGALEGGQLSLRRAPAVVAFFAPLALPLPLGRKFRLAKLGDRLEGVHKPHDLVASDAHQVADAELEAPALLDRLDVASALQFLDVVKLRRRILNDPLASRDERHLAKEVAAAQLLDDRAVMHCLRASGVDEEH
eukprot:767908-Hanusia_phi.AAC.4